MTTSVDIQGMQAAQEDFQLALDQMNSVYSAMTEEQDNLSASWSGMAASAFGQALGAWLDDLYQIRQELVVMTESLSTHTGIYSDANEASQEVVAAFQQGQGLSALDGLPTEPLVAAERVKGRLLPSRIAARRVEGRLLPEEETARRVEAPLLPLLPLLPELAVARREEEPLLPTQTLPARRLLEEPLLSREAVPDGIVTPEQPVTPALPLLPRQSIFLKSEMPDLPVRIAEAPLEPLREDLPVLPTSPPA
jgi:WXG100 family type VII secretion target